MLNRLPRARLALLSVLLCFGLFFFVPTSLIFAATIYVNSSTGNDSTGDGTSGSPYKTFHKAYTVATSSDTINLTGTFSWTDDDETGDSTTTGYTLSKSLTLVGQGADETIIQAATSSTSGTRRVFTISNTASTTIQDLQIRYGRQSSSSGGCIYAGNGGSGISLTLLRVDINNCTASQTSSGGGALAIVQYQYFFMSGSSIRNNSSGSYGGGIQFYNSSGSGYNNSIQVVNSTFSGNQNTQGSAIGGAISAEYDNVDLYITNSTFHNNKSNYGTITAYRNASISVKNTIVASSTLVSNSSPTPFYNGFGGTVTSAGYNVIGQYSSLFTTTTGDWMPSSGSATFLTLNGGSATGTLAISATPALSGGTTYTNALLEGSVGINQGSSTDHGTFSVPAVDQRSLARVGSTDVGAFEYGGVYDENAPSVSLTAPADSATVSGNTVTVSATASDDDSGVAGVSFYFGNTLIGSEDTTSPYSVTWDTTATSSSSKVLKAVARDAAGNVATSSTITVTVNNTPTAESPSITSGNNSASLLWNTTTLGSTRMFFGLLSSVATSTAEQNTGGSATTTHSVSLAGLPKCATYKYILVNKSSGGVDTATSSESTFRTACTGGSSVTSYGQESITAASGGTLTLDTLTLTVPSGYDADASSTAVFQASKLDAATVTGSIGTPNSKTRFGNIYHLNSIENNTETVSSFDEPVTVKISYAGLSGVDSSSLFIGRYDGSTWHTLSSTVNTSEQTVSATTSAFSDFGLFGDGSVEDSDDEVVPQNSITSTGSTLAGRISALIKSGDLQSAINLLLDLIKQKGGDVHPEVDSTDTSLSLTPVEFTRDLWLQSEGEDVKLLQQYLIDQGYQIRTGPTGYFGEITREALAAYQRANNITPAGGYFGEKTREAIVGNVN